jgi:hypothetical protein
MAELMDAVNQLGTNVETLDRTLAEGNVEAATVVAGLIRNDWVRIGDAALALPPPPVATTPQEDLSPAEPIGDDPIPERGNAPPTPGGTFVHT